MNPNSSYTVAVKDHFMIAHSLRGKVFGPAQEMHGATYHVTAEFSAPNVTADGIVLDIGRAQDALRNCLDPLRFKNLDEVDELRGANTTTEFLCAYLHEKLSTKLKGEFSSHLRIVLEESHVAWAAFEGPM